MILTKNYNYQTEQSPVTNGTSSETNLSNIINDYSDIDNLGDLPF